MGSPTFGLPSGNGAPQPPVFAGTNPTGGFFNFGGSSTDGSSFPSFGLFNPPNGGASPFLTPTSNSSTFNGPMSGLSSGFNFPGWGDNLGTNMLNQLGKTYGKGIGAYIGNDLLHGLFNPDVADAFLNAMQPGVNKGEGDILTSFGAEGSRFGSAASLGLGNYMSQVNLNENQTLASLYENAQMEQMNLLLGILPGAQKQRANQGGFLSSLLGAGGGMLAGGASNLDTTGGSSGWEQVLNMVVGMAMAA